MTLLLDSLRKNLSLKETATATDVLEHISRMLQLDDDEPRRGELPLTAKLAKLLGLGPDCTAATVLEEIKRRIGAEAERAIRLERPQGGGPSMSEDPRQLMSDRVSRAMREHAMPFAQALARARHEDPMLAERMETWYRGGPLSQGDRQKWDRKLVELHEDDADPREQLRLRAVEIASKENKSFKAALELATERHQELSQKVNAIDLGQAAR